MFLTRLRLIKLELRKIKRRNGERDKGMNQDMKEKMDAAFRENAGLVYRYLFCFTRDSDLAEELTQETFYQATKGIQSFRGECKLSVWLCQIGKRLWYKELEKRKNQFIPIEEAEEVASKDNLEEQYLATQDKMELFKVIQKLDEKVRNVVYLRLTGELSFAQIGEILGETENWARVTFYRGKQTLLRYMKEVL